MTNLVNSRTTKATKNRWATTHYCFNDAKALTNFSFMLDAAAEEKTTKCSNYLSPHGFEYSSFKNALTVDWVDELYRIEAKFRNNVKAVKPSLKQVAIWCNPPFDSKIKFIDICAEVGKKVPVVMLIPYERNTAWWRNNVHNKASTVYLPDGRYNFYETDGKTKKTGVNFASCFVVFEPRFNCGTQYIDFTRGIGNKK